MTHREALLALRDGIDNGYVHCPPVEAGSSARYVIDLALSECKHPVEQIADACEGTVKEVHGPLSDGSGFAIMSMPLPKTHWLYQGDRTESYVTFNVPTMPFRMGNDYFASLMIRAGKGFTTGNVIGMDRDDFADRIRAAGKYAVRCATMNGREMDFEPDALLQNLVVGMLGYHTQDGLSDDEWANPEGGGGVNWKAPEKKEESCLPQDMPTAPEF